ncbi:type II toxin-antitoxin system VapC family toxin [Chitinophaga japonensis]|uniref:Putative nucleic acid-binding protein n=1 Tax=Chitinophaga japonensis TaxID=104662 RepID=A0A562T4D0_CHIJA|nr:type II toxin-antitoxin system VapC family toxin [Chitinophaga japonensis]TWI87870.1 putative nucleic acid-binding protein [Chitinophaga japonensis]
MAYKLFLDANVILDYILKRPEGYQPAKVIFESIVRGEHQAFTSPVIIHIVAHILKKILSPLQTQKLVLALLNDVRVLDTSHDVIVQAMSAGWSDIEDALQYYTALHYKTEIFISRDEGLLKKALPTLPVYSPAAFAKLLGKG